LGRTDSLRHSVNFGADGQFASSNKFGTDGQLTNIKLEMKGYEQI